MFHYYLNNYRTRASKLAIVKPKLVLWYILTTFAHKHGSFALSVDVFKNIDQKLKSVNAIYRLKNHKILLPTFHKNAIPRKTKSFSTSWLLFLDTIFGIIHQNMSFLSLLYSIVIKSQV